MTRKRILAVVGGFIIATVIVGTTMGGGVATAADLTHGAILGHITVSQGVHVNASALPTGFHASAPVRPAMVRIAPLKSAPSSGTKLGAPASSATPAPLTTLTNAFDGIDLATANCGCQPPDVNAGVGNGYIVETTNLEFGVYDTSGTLITSSSLNNFFGTADGLSDPRVVFDPTWNRWELSVLDVSSPSLWLLYSQSGDPTGGWWIYHVAMPFPAGYITDYPNVGMDQNAFVYTTNNFGPSPSYPYVNSTAFLVPKARVYNGFGFSASVPGVAYDTTPAIVGGHPTQIVGQIIMLSPDDANNVMNVYSWTSTGANPTLTYKGAIAYNWAAPPRRVNQPGTSQTLDPLDGRIGWSATQLDGRVWFAHGVAIGSFPAVNYGYVTPGSMSITTASAFQTSTSDDFNPSISVQSYNGTPQQWLTWAYTDTPNNVPTTDVYALHVGATLAHVGGQVYGTAGASTNEYRFGDYSSSVPEYNAVGNCAEGLNALVANQFFEGNGTWGTHIARVHRADLCTP